MSVGRDAMRAARRVLDPRLDRVGRAVGFELLRRLMLATPVDTGRARGNWNASIGQEDGSDNPERRAEQALSEGSARIARLRLSRPGERLFVTNGVPYIGRLNDGYSRQAPAAFIQTTVQQMKAFVDRMAQQENLRG